VSSADAAILVSSRL